MKLMTQITIGLFLTVGVITFGKEITCAEHFDSISVRVPSHPSENYKVTIREIAKADSLVEQMGFGQTWQSYSLSFEFAAEHASETTPIPACVGAAEAPLLLSCGVSSLKNDTIKIHNLNTGLITEKKMTLIALDIERVIRHVASMGNKREFDNIQANVVVSDHETSKLYRIGYRFITSEQCNVQ
jgi:hypothetical protein